MMLLWACRCGQTLCSRPRQRYDCCGSWLGSWLRYARRRLRP